jgi:hypothetical protein
MNQGLNPGTGKYRPVPISSNLWGEEVGKAQEKVGKGYKVMAQDVSEKYQSQIHMLLEH